MGAAPALSVPPGLDSCRALLAYDADVRRAVTGLKNRDERARVTRLAAGLAALVPEVPGLVVTWAPTGGRRRRDRGFDQAELLARAVARRRGVPARPLLTRRGGAPQAGLPAADRWRHPGFAARGAAPVAVLLIDDVATTGATLSAAAATLRAAGAQVVHALVVARAPARALHQPSQ
jgi:predicted amidophosphoribosyltransferase